MPLLRLRLIGSREDADTLINDLHGLDDIEHVEEVDDFGSQMRDDSSSADSVDDSEGSVYYLEVDAPNEVVADAVRAVAENRAEQLGIVLEFVEEF